MRIGSPGRCVWLAAQTEDARCGDRTWQCRSTTTTSSTSMRDSTIPVILGSMAIAVRDRDHSCCTSVTSARPGLQVGGSHGPSAQGGEGELGPPRPKRPARGESLHCRHCSLPAAFVCTSFGTQGKASREGTLGSEGAPRVQKRVTGLLGMLENAAVEHNGTRVGSWDRDGDGALDYAEFEFGAPCRRCRRPLCANPSARMGSFPLSAPLTFRVAQCGDWHM